MASIPLQLARLARHLGRRAARKKFSIALAVGVIFFLIPLVLYFLLAYTLAGDPRLVPHAIRNARNKESIFKPVYYFQNKTDFKLLGNYDGLGEERKAEAKASCATLGISPDRCVVLNHPDLQDNPKKWWDEDIVKDVLQKHVRMWNIDLIITFDQYGISGHVNHRSVSNGVRKYAIENNHQPPAYAVQTKFVLRKYSSLADLIPTSLPFSLRILQALFVAPPEGYTGDMGPARPPAGGDRYGDKALIVIQEPSEEKKGKKEKDINEVGKKAGQLLCNFQY
ncbi:Glycan biosynthesis protein (PigL) [Rasamsonia emersonii CBS 393.64]|uniref:N-acetylglucosaminylphosphatidylinositol deacetylase n=1 Tax=Rasamsonia emersonii (strain ATCC 16479 / CBS 393.64 / IMI 116815) TaxID=1408163 RepID=A0A0F4Z698_RASE3|nr:Glycan biosynthesis protein (PigL) [Rasamsonia emersonii CBS 393.64]KKA25393.1 Glycan biosynthesis protein (PigL) [Rasamsonia emersonii CBS 393.64]